MIETSQLALSFITEVIALIPDSPLMFVVGLSIVISVIVAIYKFSQTK